MQAGTTPKKRTSLNGRAALKLMRLDGARRADQAASDARVDRGHFPDVVEEVQTVEARRVDGAAINPLQSWAMALAVLGFKCLRLGARGAMSVR